MHKTIPVLLMALILVAVPQMANACWRAVKPADRIAESYDAVIIATITDAELKTVFLNGLPTWTATAKLTGTLSGEPNTTSFVISKPDSLCEPGQTIAVTGESWVLYLRNTANGWTVAASYPLSLARKIDKRFTGQP